MAQPSQFPLKVTYDYYYILNKKERILNFHH